jgi:hypothetical protein
MEMNIAIKNTFKHKFNFQATRNNFFIKKLKDLGATLKTSLDHQVHWTTLGGKTIKCTTTITLTNYAHASTKQMLDQEGKSVLFTSLFQNKKKTLNIPLHTNPNDFTPSFKPHTISPWDILKLKKPSKLPTSC